MNRRRLLLLHVHRFLRLHSYWQGGGVLPYALNPGYCRSGSVLRTRCTLGFAALVGFSRSFVPPPRGMFREHRPSGNYHHNCVLSTYFFAVRRKCQHEAQTPQAFRKVRAGIWRLLSTGTIMHVPSRFHAAHGGSVISPVLTVIHARQPCRACDQRHDKSEQARPGCAVRGCRRSPDRSQGS